MKFAFVILGGVLVLVGILVIAFHVGYGSSFKTIISWSVAPIFFGASCLISGILQFRGNQKSTDGASSHHPSL